MRIPEFHVPPVIQKEALGQRARGRHQDRFHPPSVQNLLPSVAQLAGLLELAQQVISIEVRPAIHEHAILWVELPDYVPSPVVVNE